MKTNKIINTLVTIENVTGVYRNYYLLQRRVAYLVKLRIFFEVCIILCAYACVCHQILEYGDLFTLERWYFLLTSVNAVGAILFGCYKTKHFKEFVLKIEAVHKLFKSKITYENTKKKQSKRFYIDLLLVFAIVTTTLAYSLIYIIYITFDFFFLDKIEVFLLFTETYLEFRFCYENFVFSEFIKLIVAPLKFLKEAVSVTVEKLRGSNGETEYDNELWGIREELEKWGEASQLLRAAGDRLSDCFGSQMAISFMNATFYFIYLLYGNISFIIQKKILAEEGFGIGPRICQLITYVWLMLLVLVAGQRVQSEAEQLNRNLVILHNLLLASSGARACARDAAALARRLRAAPLRVRLFSSVKVQMTLLTGMLAIVVDYTIVLLQFNHVV